VGSAFRACYRARSVTPKAIADAKPAAITATAVQPEAVSMLMCLRTMRKNYAGQRSSQSVMYDLRTERFEQSLRARISWPKAAGRRAQGLGLGAVSAADGAAALRSAAIITDFMEFPVVGCPSPRLRDGKARN
jgi:Rod binding domain-containing protein